MALLRDELKTRGLSSDGKKADLIERLKVRFSSVCMGASFIILQLSIVQFILLLLHDSNLLLHDSNISLYFR